MENMTLMKIKTLLLLMAILLWSHLVFAAAGALVVYPGWFKENFYDLHGDLREAREAGKQGIMVFFSAKTCSYCQAIIETSLKQQDIVQRLRKHYDVIGLDVFSDNELVDLQGNRRWTKDFSVAEKAEFTPTLIFYGVDGSVQLRLIGYQSPQKMRAVLDYLEGKHYTRVSLRDFMQQARVAAKPADTQSADLNLERRKDNHKYLLVVFESSNCNKCQLLRSMLKAEVMQPYLQHLDVAFVDSSDLQHQLTTPDGKTLSAKAWADRLGLIHSPALVFFHGQGTEVVRVDTDILIDLHGNTVKPDNPHVLDNIRARLQFVVEEGYLALPQFQRWRAQQKKTVQGH